MELEQSQGANRRLPQAEGILDTMWQLKDKTAGLERAEMLECDRCLVFGLGKHRKADQVLRDIWALKKKDSGERWPETLAFGRCLGISLMNRRNYKMAAEIFRDMWTPQNTQQSWSSIAEYGHYLAVCLMEQQHYQEAEKILDDIGKGIPSNNNLLTKVTQDALRTAAEAGRKKQKRRSKK